MSRVVDVDWGELKNYSAKFTTNADELEKIANEITTAFSEVRNGWHGSDAETFSNSATSLVNSLNSEKKYLEEWSKYFVNSSGIYEDNVHDYLNLLKSVSIK